MAIGTTTAILGGALIAGGAVSAGAQIAGGRAQAKSATRMGEFNAQVYEQQAEMIKEKKKIQEYQFNRQAAFARGSIVSKTAGKGLLLSGSPLAILIDNETQMQFDKAVEDYNLDVETNFARSGAIYQRANAAEQARLAKFTGYSNAFSTLLNTGSQIGMLNFSSRGRKV